MGKESVAIVIGIMAGLIFYVWLTYLCLTALLGAETFGPIIGFAILFIAMLIGGIFLFVFGIVIIVALIFW